MIKAGQNCEAFWPLFQYMLLQHCCTQIFDAVCLQIRAVPHTLHTSPCILVRLCSTQSTMQVCTSLTLSCTSTYQFKITTYGSSKFHRQWMPLGQNGELLYGTDEAVALKGRVATVRNVTKSCGWWHFTHPSHSKTDIWTHNTCSRGVKICLEHPPFIVTNSDHPLCEETYHWEKVLLFFTFFYMCAKIS